MKARIPRVFPPSAKGISAAGISSGSISSLGRFVLFCFVLGMAVMAADASAQTDTTTVGQGSTRTYLIIRAHLPDSPSAPQLAVSQGYYTVNFGSRDGVKPGSSFRVYRTAEEYIGLVRVEPTWRDTAWVKVINLDQKIDLDSPLPMGYRYQLLPKYVFLSTVNFEAGKPVFTDDMHDRLRYVARFILSLPDYPVMLEGHTDNIGKHDENLQLGKERAEQIRTYLREVHLVPNWQMHAVGYADDRPIATNSTAAGRARNRRVDMVMMDRLPEEVDRPSEEPDRQPEE